MSNGKKLPNKELRKTAKRHPDWTWSYTGGTHVRWTHVPTGRVLFSSGSPKGRGSGFVKHERNMKKVEQGLDVRR